MSVRDTSKAALRQIQMFNPTVRARIYEAIVAGPSYGYTRRELAVLLRIDLSSVCGRVHELMQAGSIVELPARRCDQTGRGAHPLIAAPHTTFKRDTQQEDQAHGGN